MSSKQFLQNTDNMKTLIIILLSTSMYSQCYECIDYKVVPLIDNDAIASVNTRIANGESVEIVINGDSNVAGENSFAGPLKQKFWNEGNYCGTGWHSTFANFAPLGTFSFPSGNIEYLRQSTSAQQPSGQPAGGGIIHESALMHLGSSFSFSVQQGVQGSTADMVDFYYEKGTGDFEYRVGNGSWVFVENSTGSGVGEVNYSHGIIDRFAFAVRPVEDGLIIYGINRYIDNCNGVLIHKAGFSGYAAFHTRELITLPSWQYIVGDLAPDLYMVTLGSNGTGNNTFAGFDITPEGYTNDLSNYFDAIQSASPNTEIQYLGFPDNRGQNGLYKRYEYHAAMCIAAENNGWGFANLLKYHGTIHEAVANGVIGQDSVHYTSVGGLANGIFLCRILEIE